MKSPVAPVVDRTAKTVKALNQPVDVFTHVDDMEECCVCGRVAHYRDLNPHKSGWMCDTCLKAISTACPELIYSLDEILEGTLARTAA
jgi:hypothetical protein